MGVFIVQLRYSCILFIGIILRKVCTSIVLYHISSRKKMNRETYSDLLKNVNIQNYFLTVEASRISLILVIANSIGYQICNKVEDNLLERLKTKMIMGNIRPSNAKCAK